jgi:hypothetical protein
MSNKKSKINVFVAWDEEYLSWLDEKTFRRVYNVLDANIVLFTGGADVNPSFYGEHRGNFTYFAESRDLKDNTLYGAARENNKRIFFVGICRGAQFLTVKAGGTLFQDVTGHAIKGTHDLSVSSEYLSFVNQDIVKASMSTLPITSTHHQMMNPYNLDPDDYDMVATCDGIRSAWYLNGDNKIHQTSKDMPEMDEPEVVMYKNINALCIQGHPERLPYNSITVRFLNRVLLNEYNKAKRRIVKN